MPLETATEVVIAAIIAEEDKNVLVATEPANGPRQVELRITPFTSVDMFGRNAPLMVTIWVEPGSATDGLRCETDADCVK